MALLIEPGDSQEHLAVPHAVEAAEAPRHDPEEALLEDAVLLRLSSKTLRHLIQAGPSLGCRPLTSRLQRIRSGLVRGYRPSGRLPRNPPTSGC